ncbi:MAG: hypothetical protein COC09_04515 [Gammaproteobacteria bacterium]|nr:NusG domain II-containing protein [Gammaproteobacteria bacterium]PCH63854.1 MAG: hypothetical protein COC09_04515 [Gammaproteobacteria bacterium]
MTRLDLLIIVVALAALPLLYWQLWGPNYRGTEVNILVGNQKAQRYSLLRDQTLAIRGKLGDSIIHIKNGSAAFIQSPCPNKQCIHSGWQHRNGDTTACLPNRITLSVVGDGFARFDSVNF